MKNSLNNEKNDSKINIDTIVEFCKSHVKYISAGVLTLVLVIVLAVAAVNGSKDGDKKDAQNTQQQQKEETETYQVNKNEDLKKLIENYYTYYAAGNVKKLAKIATPVSDMEKSYIKMMSGFLEGYEDIVCYTKKGLDKDSYMVSVTFGMKFKDVKGTLPGMEFFYVKTNEKGNFYIDNLYSSFNSEMEELETDAEISSLIDKFKDDADVKELQAEFQSKYTEAVSSNKKLQKMVDKVTAGIKDWAASYAAQNTEEEKKTEEEQKKAEEEKKKAEAEQKKAEEEKKKAEEEQKKAEEEQTGQENNSEGSGVNYIPEGKVLTANDAYNVRTSMSETSEKLGTVAIGDSIKVILSYAEGWTKVEWNGKTGYIKTELLLNN